MNYKEAKKRKPSRPCVRTKIFPVLVKNKKGLVEIRQCISNSIELKGSKVTATGIFNDFEELGLDFKLTHYVSKTGNSILSLTCNPKLNELETINELAKCVLNIHYCILNTQKNCQRIFNTLLDIKGMIHEETKPSNKTGYKQNRSDSKRTN